MWQKYNTLLVDVRPEREYGEEHINSAINAPLLSILKNPFMFSENREKNILLYCMEGYQSKAAAQCLKEAGYKNVAFFAWNKKER
jgi:rhodanese-related sulfurtransferase